MSNDLNSLGKTLGEFVFLCIGAGDIGRVHRLLRSSDNVIPALMTDEEWDWVAVAREVSAKAILNGAPKLASDRGLIADLLVESGYQSPQKINASAAPPKTPVIRSNRVLQRLDGLR